MAKQHPGMIQQRAGSWVVILRVAGERHRFGPRSDPFLGHADSKNEVVEWTWTKYRELEKQAERQASGLPGPMPFSALLDRFKESKLTDLAEGTQKAYRASLARFRTYFVEHGDNPRVDKIRPGHVEGFLDWRRDNPGRGSGQVSARTVNKDRAVLHRLFSYAERLEIVPSNPVSKTDPRNVDERDPVILDGDQFEALLKACGTDDHGRPLQLAPMLRLYVLVLAETGMRCESEALWLRWEDVRLEDGFIKVETERKGRRTKSGNARWVPMTPRLASAMREHFARYRFAEYNGTPTRWLFHHTRTRRRADAGERIGSLRRGFNAAVERAELPADLNQHDLRHRRVTTWLAEGKNPVHVKEAVGHADLRTTMGYTHLAREHLRSLVDDNDSERKETALAR